MPFLRSYGLILSSLLLFSAPLAFAQVEPPTSETSTEDETDPSNEVILDKMELFAEVLTRVRDYYVDPKDEKELIEAALDGALSSLDPHSSYADV